MQVSWPQKANLPHFIWFALTAVVAAALIWISSTHRTVMSRHYLPRTAPPRLSPSRWGQTCTFRHIARYPCPVCMRHAQTLLYCSLCRGIVSMLFYVYIHLKCSCEKWANGSVNWALETRQPPAAQRLPHSCHPACPLCVCFCGLPLCINVVLHVCVRVCVRVCECVSM